jgi:probable phosphomutase (TIGR03848 family)
VRGEQAGSDAARQSGPTTFLLVRHGACDGVGRVLCGRAPGIVLNAEGRRQADALAERLPRLGIKAVYSSPLERAHESAAVLATCLGLPVALEEGIQELDYGDWTGRSLEELASSPEWRWYNQHRSSTRIPGGEMLLEAQLRAVETLNRLRCGHRGEVVAVVSHGDIIRSVVAHYAGVHLDVVHRLEISPASVSIVRVGDGWAQVLAVNNTGELRIG